MGSERMKQLTCYIYNFLFTNRTKGQTIYILFFSAYYRLKILILPKTLLEKELGVQGKESPYDVDYEERKAAYWVGQRVERTCDKTLWESKCLVKAMIAQRMLSKKNIPTTLYLGVRTSKAEMLAHAWLRCGSVYVTGGDGGDNVVVGMYYK